MTDSNNNATPQFLTFSLPGGETRQTARPTQDGSADGGRP